MYDQNYLDSAMGNYLDYSQNLFHIFISSFQRISLATTLIGSTYESGCSKNIGCYLISGNSMIPIGDKGGIQSSSFSYYGPVQKDSYLKKKRNF